MHICSGPTENGDQQYSTAAVEKQNIIDTVNAGVGLVNYLGHSAPRNWGSGLFSNR